MNGSKNITSVMIIIAVCSIGGIIFSSSQLVPRFNELQKINKTIKGIENTITYKEKYYKELQDIETKIKEYEPELAKIDVALPDYPSMPSFFDYLQKNTSQSGLVINNMGSFTVSNSSQNPGLKEISLSLGVSGSYESLKNFLSVLEKSSRLIDVGSVSFGSSQDSQGTNSQSKNIFTFSLAIKAYSY